MNDDKVNIFIPSEDHIISLFQTRKIDIQTRGKDCYVFDKNNEIVTLEKCSIWYVTGRLTIILCVLSFIFNGRDV